VSDVCCWRSAVWAREHYILFKIFIQSYFLRNKKMDCIQCEGDLLPNEEIVYCDICKRAAHTVQNEEYQLEAARQLNLCVKSVVIRMQTQDLNVVK
jgi:hypothetical protein